ncbi:hypothetical protein B0A55_12630 [Friedmanniomyces simplex]|uniref:ADP-ribose 1''-phosphate phosphatase n=1 Tax=Friedmanniomyces simplex TaxID=329884 RepID=A0A4U0WGJ7_9PEZI|nr:hypothetical protein B0A55_12630 [Friedmanniomyces simplex]
MAAGTLDSWMSAGCSGPAKKRKSGTAHDDPLPTKRAKPDTKPKPQESTPATKSKPEPTPLNATPTLALKEETGDIFAAPPNTLLIHACNTDGSWSGGIAQAFQSRYPSAFQKYAEHCHEIGGAKLVGTAQLIPPQSGDSSKHFVGCLFTSRHYGRRKDPPAKILAATGVAMEELLKQVKGFNAGVGEGERVGEVRICRINSGLFRVPWGKTTAVLEGLGVGGEDVRVVKVVSPPEEEE